MFGTKSNAIQTPLEKRQAATRQKILGTTLKMIREEGIDKVSWRGIARAVNYSPAGLYEYFKNKDDIVATLAEEGMIRLEAALQTVNPNLPLEERLVALGKAYIAYAHSHPDLFSLVFSTLPSIRRSMEEPVAGAYKRVVDLMQEGIDKGTFHSDGSFNADVMAYCFWSLVHGMASLQLSTLKGFKANFERADQEGMRRFAEGLKR